jgi:hypothetical protein
MKLLLSLLATATLIAPAFAHESHDAPPVASTSGEHVHIHTPGPAAEATTGVSSPDDEEYGVIDALLPPPKPAAPAIKVAAPLSAAESASAPRVAAAEPAPPPAAKPAVKPAVKLSAKKPAKPVAEPVTTASTKPAPKPARKLQKKKKPVALSTELY